MFKTNKCDPNLKRGPLANVIWVMAHRWSRTLSGKHRVDDQFFTFKNILQNAVLCFDGAYSIDQTLLNLIIKLQHVALKARRA